MRSKPFWMGSVAKNTYQGGLTTQIQSPGPIQFVRRYDSIKFNSDHYMILKDPGLERC